MRRGFLLAMIALVVVAIAGGVIAYRALDVRTRFDTAVEGVRDALKEPRRDNCGDKVPFRPEEPPQGWRKIPQCGSPERVGGVVDKGRARTQAIGFFDAGEGFVYVVKGDFAFSQRNKKRIKVLNRPATLGDIHNGYSVRLVFKGERWTLVAYIGEQPRKNFEAFATSLVKG
jgi:hypothetical protein